MGARIVIENVTFSYKPSGKLVLDDLSVSIPAGSIFGLVGRNGSGKTTLFGLILDMLKPTKGTVHILGREDQPLTPGTIGFLPEQPYYHLEFRLIEYLGHLSRISPNPRSQEEIEKALEYVALTDAQRVHLRDFSKGMLQRAGIAQAILQHPQVMILDEPMSGLDPLGQRLIRDIITKIHAAGTTILISSHNLYEIDRMSTHIGVLNEGKITLLDRRARKSEEQITIETVADEGRLRELFAQRPAIRVKGQNLVFLSTPDLYQEVISLLLEEQIIIRQLLTSGHDLETLTLDYLGKGGEGHV